MKYLEKVKFLFLVLFLFISTFINAQNRTDSVTISGWVTDYGGNPLDSVSVNWLTNRFSEVKAVLTNEDGYYEAKIPKGRYYAMGALNMSKYIIAGSTLPEDDLRLEFWAWNFIADRDTVFNIQYHRLEVYGVNVFRIQGAVPGYTIYCRPMSLTRYLVYSKNKVPEGTLAPHLEQLDVKVTINGVEVPVRMKQEVLEYFGHGESSNAYMFFVDLPKNKGNLPYDVFRIQLSDLENGDKGEATYFLEKKDYVE